eukprot:m51a1_g9869 hypothetical protein (196) ;mRNA; r:73210-73866
MPMATSSLVGRTYILDKWIQFETAIATEATKDVYCWKIKLCSDHGWLQLFKDMQMQNFDLTAGSYKPDKGPVVVKTNVFNRCFKILDIYPLQFDIQTKVFYLHIDNLYTKWTVNAHQFLGNPELPIYNVPLCVYPEMHQQAMCGIEFTNIMMPYLKIDLPLYNQDLTVSVNLFMHNYIRQVILGQNTAIETVQSI